MTTHRCGVCGDTYSGGTCLRCKQNKRGVESGLTIHICAVCHMPGLVASNGYCQRCMRAQKLKECRVCRAVECELLAFTPGKRVCRSCRAKQNTRAAMRELEAGGGRSFNSVADLMADLESDD